jgi:GNAT superfamily N-acetyltransferase
MRNRHLRGQSPIPRSQACLTTSPTTRAAGHLGAPEFRKQGIATELIRRVLDDVRAQGKTVTIMCRIVRTFIERNAEYADLIDPEHPGVTKGLPRRKV